MKKILLSLLAVMISFTALAQTKGDKLTINMRNGTSQAWDLTADGQAPVSKITHSADGKVGFVMTGLEDYGAFEIYDINDINKHELDRMVEFLKTYKNLQKKTVEITGIGNREEALALIRKFTIAA